MPLQTKAYGPFIKGAIDNGDASLNLSNAAKSLKGLVFTGAGKLATQDGTRVVLTLKDDSGGHATITSVNDISSFADGCLIVGHSTVTQKAYLYRLNATFDTWTDSGGSTHNDSTPQPIGVLWSSMPNPPVVTVTEGLGVAYIAHATGADGTTLSFPFKQFTDSSRAIVTVTSDLDLSGGAEDLYALGTIAFQQHLWIWGVGSGTVAATMYRPELARFSQPNFGAFLPSDSITLGNRVRSLREGIVGGFVAGEALFLGAPYLVSRVTGYGRSSWYKKPLESSYGFSSPKCGVAVSNTLYWWSPRGPMRCMDSGEPEGLFDAVAGLVAQVVNPQTIVAGFDAQKDLVNFSVDIGTGTRTRVSYDVRRQVWLGPANDWGLAIGACGQVTPIYAATAAATLGPAAAPNTASTDTVGGTTARAVWVNGDGTSPTQVQFRLQGTSPWTTAATVSAGLTNYTFTGLSLSTAYEWRCAHVKDGITSAFLGPSASTQFTTAASDNPLLAPTLGSLNFDSGTNVLNATWINSGESGVSTEVDLAPSPGVSFVTTQTAGPGVSSAGMSISVTDTYYVRVRHTKSGRTPSAYSGPSSILCNVGGS